MTQHRTLNNRLEWLGARRIGSSDVAPLLGLPAFADHTEWDVWERLYHRRVVDRRPTLDQARGVDLEQTCLERYRELTGATDMARPRPHTVWVRDGWASATPDCVRRGLRRVVEAKTDRRRYRWGESQVIERWDPWVRHVLPVEYYHQVHHQLFVLDLPAGDLAVLLPPDLDDAFGPPELRVFTILRDRELEERVVHRLRAWWDLHVVRGMPPEYDGSAAADRWLADIDADGSMPATPQQVALAAAYDTAKKQRNEWDEQRRRIGQVLVASAGWRRKLTMPGGHVTMVRGTSEAKLDERALLEDHPELAPLLATYRRAGTAYVYPKITTYKRRNRR